MKKLLTSMLVLAMACAMFAVPVFAAEVAEPETEAEVYMIDGNMVEVLAESENSMTVGITPYGSSKPSTTLDAGAWSGWIYSRNNLFNETLKIDYISGPGKMDVEVYFAGTLHDSKALGTSSYWNVSTPSNVGQVTVRINNNTNVRGTFVVEFSW